MLCGFEGPGDRSRLISGGFGVGETPLPIPNRAVKPHSADGTWPSRARESRSPPVYLHEPPSGGSSSLSGVVPDSSAVGEATLLARPAVRLWRPGEGMRRGARARAAARGSRLARSEGTRAPRRGAWRASSRAPGGTNCGWVGRRVGSRPAGSVRAVGRGTGASCRLRCFPLRRGLARTAAVAKLGVLDFLHLWWFV